MKYWLFDGNDVVGPFAPEELAARKDFSANSLICAEASSEDETGWQMASSFDTFHFNAVTRKIECIVPTTNKTSLPSADPLPQAIPENNSVDMQKTDEPQQFASPSKELSLEKPKSVPIPSQEISVTRRYPENLPFVRLSKEKPLRPSYSPVMLASENVDLVLPENKIVNEESAPKLDLPENSVATKAEVASPIIKDSSAKPTDLQTEKIAAESTLETKQVSTITLPIVNEILVQNDLPKLPVKNDLVVESSIESNDGIKDLEQSQENISSAPSSLDDFFELTQTTNRVDSPVSSTTDIFEKQPKNDSTLGTSQAEILHEENEPRESSCYAIEEMESQASFLEESSPQRAHKMLFFFLALVGLGALCYGGIYYYRQSVKIKMKSAETESLVPVEKQVALPSISASVPISTQTPMPTLSTNSVVSVPKPIVASKPQTSSDKALAVVQTYQLSGNRGTVASYFDRLYQEQLAQGYTAEWSVEPLHKNIYIVKYRLAKTRTEPIVYVFQADISHNRLTGALNNITLDLLGKI